MCSPDLDRDIVAVDVGNSAIHLGWFEGASEGLPQPDNVFDLQNSLDDFGPLANWAKQFVQADTPWCIASVNDVAKIGLLQWLTKQRETSSIREVSHEHCPIPIAVDHPERVGIDRLMAAVAAWRMCANQPAIVIDAGTAVTVDLLRDGRFAGGAILPGMRMSAAALDRYTDKLPYIETVGIAPPDAIGKNTADAMKSGMFWGTVGAIRELASRMAESVDSPPRVFLTGGDSATIAPLLENAEHVPNMVLSGIAITAALAERRDG